MDYFYPKTEPTMTTPETKSAPEQGKTPPKTHEEREFEKQQAEKVEQVKKEGDATQVIAFEGPQPGDDAYAFGKDIGRFLGAYIVAWLEWLYQVRFMKIRECDMIP